MRPNSHDECVSLTKSIPVRINSIPAAVVR